MTLERVVAAGLIGALAAALASAILGLGARSAAGRRAAHLLSGVGSAAGLAGALIWLIGGLAPLSLWASPFVFGAPLAVDRLSAFFLVLLHAVSLATAWFGWRYVEDEGHAYPPRLVVPLGALFVFGMQGVLLSTGAASFLLCWEVMSLSSCFLVMADRGEVSRRAALLYLAVAQFGAGALLVGMGLAGGGRVSATLADLGAGAATLPPAASALATSLVLFAFVSKAGLAPFHAWLPEAHPRAPSHISALMSGVMLKTAVYGLLRFTEIDGPALGLGWGAGLMALGFGGAIVAVVYANLARDIKRILAWSSVENLGLVFAMIGFSLVARRSGAATVADAVLAAMYVHLAAHALFKSGLFLGAGAVVHATHTAKIESLGGLANRMPQLSAAMLVLALAGAAMPPSGAFVAEWLLLQSLVVSLAFGGPALAAAAAAALVSVAFVTGLAVFAMVRLFGFVFLAEPRSEAARLATEAPVPLRGPVIGLAVLVVGLGIASPWASPLFPVPLPPVTLSLAPDGATASPAALPMALGVAMAVALASAWGLVRLLTRGRVVRRFHTWDCGQPIDSTMEYTATAFSAPVRYFLRDIVRAEKHLVFDPLVASNPWMRRGRMEFRKAGGTLERLYLPVATLIETVGGWLKRLQNGVIQFYVALILATLLVTLWVAL